MDDVRKAYGDWALIAGAAEGIGAAFSRLLAQNGMNLLMADNNAVALHSISTELEQKFGIKTEQLVIDLEEKDAWKVLMNGTAGKECGLLVYNAAYSKVRPFLENTPADLDRFLEVNAGTLIRLVHAFAASLRGRRPGGILLMSSLAGLIGPRYVAPYAATKAFALTLAEALFHEFAEQGIRITACCAGTTATPTYLNSVPAGSQKKPFTMNPDGVATYAMSQLGKKAICIPGWQNRLNYFFLRRVLGRSQSARIVSNYMVKLYPGLG